LNKDRSIGAFGDGLSGPEDRDLYLVGFGVTADPI
jgi:hypothetical protein